MAWCGGGEGRVDGGPAGVDAEDLGHTDEPTCGSRGRGTTRPWAPDGELDEEQRHRRIVAGFEEKWLGLDGIA